MKKVISVILSAVALLSIMAMPMAIVTGGGEGNVPVDTGTDVVLSGKYTEAYYQVTVPATMSPGDSGQVKVVGAWKPSQTLKVTCPNKVTLAYGEQTLDVGITFEGIEQAGSLLDEFSITKDISVENKTVMFGTWTGHLTYNVEMVEDSTGEDSGNTNEPAKFIQFTIDATNNTAEEDMTWTEWIDSDWDPETDTRQDVYIVDNNGYVKNTLLGTVIGFANLTPVKATDTISAGTVYYNVQYPQSEANLITFYILSTDGTDGYKHEYNAEEGMTWGEWLDSEYNTSDCWVDPDDSLQVVCIPQTDINNAIIYVELMYNATSVKGTHVIVAGATYGIGETDMPSL